MKKALLIDGHSILNRAFYGVPDLTNGEGIHTNAIYGFLNILFKIMDEEHPDYLAVAFDRKAPTFRHKMYEGYKGTRKGMPEELREQVPLMKEVLTSMEIPLLEMDGYEADDLLGTVASSLDAQGLCVSVLSGDRDLLQLATDRVCIRIPKTKKNGTEIEDYFAADVEAVYSVTPKEFIEVKALMGDSSDNIPGLPGVGEKTAISLIKQYKTVENVKLHGEEIKPKRAREAVLEHFDLAELSRKLVEIDTHAPISLTLEEAVTDHMFNPKSLEMMKRLELKNLIGRFQFEKKDEVKNEKNIVVSPITDADAAVNVFENEKELGFFIFGKEEDPLLFALSSKEHSVLLDTEETGMEEASESIHRILKRCLAQGKTLYTFGVKEQSMFFPPLSEEERKGIIDIAIGAYLLNPLKGSYPYDEVRKDLTGELVDSAVELLGKTKLTEAYEKDKENLCKMVSLTAECAYVCAPFMYEQLEEKGMRVLFETLEMPLCWVLYDMEGEGISVRKEDLVEYGKVLAEKILVLEKEIYELAGEKFNINSPKQLGVILFEKLGLPGGKKTKTGYSTAADVLEKLAPEYPLVEKVLDYRQVSKLKSTYADGLAGCIKEDGKIHCTFQQTVTATGRLSCTDPNLQNIPIRMELGRLIRKVFVPKEGCVFLDADYSQIELRVLAHISGDEKLIRAYADAKDIHAITASQVFHVPEDEVTPLQRRNAKAVNFGIVYGISSFGLSQDLSITKKEAQEYIERYFETYPGIKKFLDESVRFAKESGYAKTLTGRLRPVPELNSGNFMQRSFGERVAMNSPIQGTAADIIKEAMIRVSRRLRREEFRSRLILQVHDELLLEVPVEELEAVSALLREEMEASADLLVRLEVDMHSGSNWYEAK